jgi:hypothetical protein
MFYEIGNRDMYCEVVWWVKDFMICLMNYEREMLLNEAWTWKQKYDIWSMNMSMNKEKYKEPKLSP